ncbi:hypothetical protein [Sulfobacillus harzensis]|uniref:Uncharacterized protein n=1 Tax=Sulfobacillus harzensis TaxID=2729629 RepID=A0A7Y0Q4V8_9FIRM|nr:hypothetical protein [Sulfobacillus harzensis]NMP25022.1 hypothetical protein [Sulfobacillus harzensis]
MAMNRFNNDADFKHLCDLAHLAAVQALTIMREEGMVGIRVRAAASLYQTDPAMDTGDAAEFVGLRNRGLLVQYILDHHIAPITPNDPEI